MNITLNLGFNVMTIVLGATLSMAGLWVAMLRVSVNGLRNLANWAEARALALEAYKEVYDKHRILPQKEAEDTRARGAAA